MKDAKPLYHGNRFPPAIISHAVWLNYRFCLSLRDVEDLLAERGIAVSYESIRQWCNQFGPEYARKLKKRQGRLSDTWYLDEGYCQLNLNYSDFLENSGCAWRIDTQAAAGSWYSPRQ